MYMPRIFYGPDAGGAGGGVDLEISPFEDDSLQIETVQDEPAGPSREDIEKQLSELKAQNEALAARADQGTLLKSSFDRFGERLEQVAGRPQAPTVAQQPGETAEAFKQRINSKILEDPYETMLEFTNKVMGGAFQTVADQMLATQRKIAYLESDDKEFFTRHQKEIDEEVQRTPLDQRVRDADVYKRAIDMVKARNMGEIIAAEVAKAVAAAGGTPPAATPRAPAGLSDAPTTPRAPVSSPAGLPGASAPSSGPRKVQMTPAKLARVQSRQAMEGLAHIPLGTYVEMLMDDGIYDKI